MPKLSPADHGIEAAREATAAAAIDPEDFLSSVPPQEKVAGLSQLPEAIRSASENVGMETEKACRAGSYLQVDHSAVFSASEHQGLEVMALAEARSRYRWLEGHLWSLVARDADRFTAAAADKPHGGYVIRARPGVKADFPLQACLLMTRDGMAQNVHNVVIAEEGSDLSLITGCAAEQAVNTGLHVGITEFHVRKGARVSFTMVHHWTQGMAVRPRSSAVIEEGGSLVSNYICIHPVRSLQMYPAALCRGNGARARFNNILLSYPGCVLDVGSKAVLAAEGCRAEILTRAATTGGDITARGLLLGQVPGVRAHLECRGLMLSPEGTIHAVPELVGRVRGVDLTHEAAVGKIAEEEVLYLMARGLTEEEAVAAIVRGFLDVEIKGLPDRLQEELKRVVGDAVAGGGM